MTVTSNYKIWLKAVAEYFEIDETEIVKSHYRRDKYAAVARHTFYWLCYRDEIDLYRLSIALGKERSTIMTTLNRKSKKDNKIINKIWNNVKTNRT